MFLQSLKASFLSRTSANTFSPSIFDKHKRWKNFNFLTKIMDYPLWKNANFVGFLNRCYHCPKRLVCFIKRRKSFFYVFFFSRSITWEYRGLQGAIRGYRGLQGDTRGDRSLQGVTVGYKGLQGVTNDSRNFFLTRTLPDTFCMSFLRKNQSWRNLKFLIKTMDLPLWKNCKFAFLINSCSYSL